MSGEASDGSLRNSQRVPSVSLKAGFGDVAYAGSLEDQVAALRDDVAEVRAALVTLRRTRSAPTRRSRRSKRAPGELH
jgi:hypothetical protein